MTSLTETVRSEISSRGLLRAGQPVLVAVSGGVDSMVLLAILHSLSKPFRWKLTVAHFNHQLRGLSSNADERLVSRTCASLGVPVTVGRANVRAFAKSTGVSLEMAGRTLRHRFLAKAASDRGIRTIAVAHHLDDQIELLFIRLLRGSGTQGLAGMKWSSASPVDPQLEVVRPLLNCSKQVLQEYSVQHGVQFREDASNASVEILRNRIRHELLPLLRTRYQPALDRAITRVMRIVSDESSLTWSIAEEWLARHRIAKKDDSRRTSLWKVPNLSSYSFEELPAAVQRCCVQHQLLALGVEPDFELIEHLRRHPGKQIEVSRTSFSSPKLQPDKTDPGTGLVLKQQQGRVTPVKTSPKTDFEPGSIELNLAQAGKKRWHGVEMSWRLKSVKGPKLPARKKGEEFFDAAALGRRVVVRHWRPGDRIEPIGMGGTVKIQDWFVNLKLPQARRRKLLVGTTEHGQVFWVEGLRISERFKLTPGTIRRLHWRWQRL
ncbi:MAG TPA: tRNA lysidine(34) synthetase TilS [Verrucomicrobiae bacterium]|nr:tRNA lysidine(34) synthetase TilS [Verrucomicrobiae bacterium]